MSGFFRSSGSSYRLRRSWERSRGVAEAPLPIDAQVGFRTFREIAYTEEDKSAISRSISTMER